MTGMKRYKYILSGIVDLGHPACYYRLVAGNQLREQDSAVRIEIPDDMEVRYEPGEGYSTTDDHRPLEDLRPVPMVKINGRWAKRPGLDPMHLHEWFLRLQEQDGLYPSFDREKGYVPKEQWTAEFKARSAAIATEKAGV